jgi:hypothetical protein
MHGERPPTRSGRQRARLGLWRQPIKQPPSSLSPHFPAPEPTWLVYCVLQGGRPVAISSTVQATDQRSAWRPCPVWVITSGAIQ